MEFEKDPMAYLNMSNWRPWCCSNRLTPTKDFPQRLASLTPGMGS